MSFVWAEGLPVLLLVPLVGSALWMLDRARTGRLARTVGPRVPTLATGGPRRRRITFFTTALLLALLAMLQPSWGKGTGGPGQRGVDILVCLDVSRSMLARDIEPSRLERAQREIAALADRGTGDRMGLVVFAGDARLAVPLTRDMASFKELAGRADPLSVPRGGSDLGAALTTALAALEGHTGKHEAIVLLTDGEDHEGRALRVADACRERGIVVHCIGLGTALGGKIPVDGGFLRDRSGAEVVSRLDPATLQRIAAAADGVYAAAALGDVYDRHIAPMARHAFRDRESRERENRFQWPLLAAFLLWMVDLCVSDRKRRS